MENGKNTKIYFQKGGESLGMGLFDRIIEVFKKVAQEEARKLSTVQEIMMRSTDYLRRTSITDALAHVVFLFEMEHRRLRLES